MKQKRVAADIMLIIAFFILITFPFFFSNFEGGKISQVENRVLAKVPDLKNPSEAGIRMDIENWINDNIGFRSLASITDTVIQWKFFGMSAKADTLVGKDKWLFYYREDIGADYRHMAQLTNEQMNDFLQDLETIVNYIRKHGASPLIVMLPDKKTVYPEKFPVGQIISNQPSRADNIYAAAQAYGTLPMMWICGALMEARNIGYLYSPRIDNAHWNKLGAYVGYEEICKALKQMYIPELSYVPLSNCVIEEFTSTAHFNGAVEISEKDYHVITGTEGHWHDDSEYLDRFKSLTYAGDAYDYKVRLVNENEGMPKLLYIGDSYTLAMFDYLAQSFSEVTFLHTVDMLLLPEMIEELHPDIVVVEWVERQFHLERDCVNETAAKIEYIKSQQTEGIQ